MYSGHLGKFISAFESSMKQELLRNYSYFQEVEVMVDLQAGLQEVVNRTDQEVQDTVDGRVSFSSYL